LRRLAFWVALAAALPAATAPTIAAVVDTPDETARRYQERGTTYFNLGQFEDAVAEFRRAYEAKADSVFLFNIAEAYRQLDAKDQALFFYRRYLSTNPQATNRPLVEERIKGIEELATDATRDPGAVSSDAALPAAPLPASSTATQPPSGTAPTWGPGAGREADSSSQDRFLLRQWWFWAGVGAVVVSGVVTFLVVASRRDERGPPKSVLGNARVF